MEVKIPQGMESGIAQGMENGIPQGMVRENPQDVEIGFPHYMKGCSFWLGCSHT